MITERLRERLLETPSFIDLNGEIPGSVSMFSVLDTKGFIRHMPEGRWEIPEEHSTLLDIH